MFEELLANLPLTPTMLVIAGIIAVLCLWLGWTFKGFGVKRREAGLKQEIMVAKASVPQLESDVRNRDQQIERIQQRLEEFKEENASLSQRTEQAEKEMRTAQRQVSNLTSEVNAVKGVSKEADNMIIDGFDDERAHEATDESPLAARLRKTEAAYEKLKGALIKRDDRIDDLEEKLHTSKQGDASLVADEGNDQSHALQADVDKARETIAELQSQLIDVRQEKEMLEELANRRSKSNRALKEATAEAQEQVPALQQQLEEHLKTISDREASISRLLKDVETTKADLTAQLDQTQTLEQELATQTNTLTQAQAQAVAQQQELSSRDQHISQLDDALVQSATAIAGLEKQIEAAEGTAQLHQEAVDALAQANGQKQELEEVIAQRNITLAALNADLDRLGVELAATKEQAARAAVAAERRCSEADAKTAESQSHVQRLKFELEDVSASLAQQERWMEKLKKSLSDREAVGAQMEQQVETLNAQVSSVNAELQYQQVALEMMEAEKRTSEEQVQVFQQKSEQAYDELAKVELELARAELKIGAGVSSEANLAVDHSAPGSRGQPVESTGMSAEVIQIRPTSAMDRATTREPRLYTKGAKSGRLSQRRRSPAAAPRKTRSTGVVRSRQRRQTTRARPVRLHQKKQRIC